jgi:hypothetical protein
MDLPERARMVTAWSSQLLHEIRRDGTGTGLATWVRIVREKTESSHMVGHPELVQMGLE